MNLEDLGSNKEFIDEEITKIICDAIFHVFGLKAKFENSESKTVDLTIENDKDQSTYNAISYKKEKSSTWCNQLMDQCLRALIKLDKPYKYVVTCVMQQNTGAPICSMGGAFFEETDGAVCKTISINNLYFSLSIYGLAI